ncbi:MAG: right-handed parallel beta-helix repeat-containing protein [Odoribacteraceae bacterium]|jgi:polygalacturonase|nr:right-handed parallel beta-helix repeat-containing protein [Odoribacteraceae bacterium]
MKTKYYLHVLLLLLATTVARAGDGIPDFPWMKDVGAHRFPAGEKIYHASAHGAIGDAIFDCTAAIQSAIDNCAANGGGIVTFAPGIYLTGSLFIRSGVNFNIPKGTTLLGSQQIEAYREIDTRVAGIEMRWPAALLNIIDAKQAAITGDGVVHGKGKIFWDMYRDMRKEYDPKKLRWIVDYDAKRPRGILVANSEDVTVKDIVIYQPGFWSLHILYSSHVTVDGVIISNNIEGRGPSTDGVDIDSSSDILVQNSNINCNDDNFCLKAGRDSDGLRVNRPCQRVVIRDCVAGHGDGLFTCGSETSGGIRDIVAYNLKGIGTKYGLRFKSTVQRGGTIENIWLCNIEMVGVRNPFIVDLNWNPAYSTSLLPAGYDPATIPDHWKKMLAPVSIEQGTPKFKNIHFERVTATDAGTCIVAAGLEGRGTIDAFSFKSCSFSGTSAGSIRRANDWTFEDFSMTATNGKPLEVKDCRGVNP